MSGQDEHRAYKKMCKVKGSKFSSRSERMQAENNYLREKLNSAYERSGEYYRIKRERSRYE